MAMALDCSSLRWVSSIRSEVRLTTLQELGGPGGDGANPEKLFSAGYAGAPQLAAVAACGCGESLGHFQTYDFGCS